jgi:hypothetical protein
VGVHGAERPAEPGLGAVVDRLADQLDAEAAPPHFFEDVDVGEVGEYFVVGDHAGEADLSPFPVEPHHPGRLAHEALDHLPRTSLRPVGLVGEVVVDGVDVDPRTVVVELEAVG